MRIGHPSFRKRDEIRREHLRPHESNDARGGVVLTPEPFVREPVEQRGLPGGRGRVEARMEVAEEHREETVGAKPGREEQPVNVLRSAVAVHIQRGANPRSGEHRAAPPGPFDDRVAGVDDGDRCARHAALVDEHRRESAQHSRAVLEQDRTALLVEIAIERHAIDAGEVRGEQGEHRVTSRQVQHLPGDHASLQSRRGLSLRLNERRGGHRIATSGCGSRGRWTRRACCPSGQQARYSTLRYVR